MPSAGIGRAVALAAGPAIDAGSTIASAAYRGAYPQMSSAAATWKVSAGTAHPQRIDQAMAGAIGSPPNQKGNCHEHLG